MANVCVKKKYSSFFHHHGPSTSFASQSSLGIIMENSTIETRSQLPQRSHSLKDRSEYEQLDGDFDDYDDELNGSSSCSSSKNADKTNQTGPMKGSRGWRNVRAVMAYYYTLRKIKRNGASLLYIYTIHRQFILSFSNCNLSKYSKHQVNATLISYNCWMESSVFVDHCI